MSLRNISIALASVVVLAAAPALAQDAAIIQDNVQTNVTTGNRNNTRSTNNQSAGISQGGRGTGDAGISQRSDSLNDVAGNGNRTVSENNQSAGTTQRVPRPLRP
jgi:hypothetical protein